MYDDIDLAALQAFDEVSFYLADEDGEVEGVQEVKVEWLDNADIIYLADTLATVEFPALFTFDVQAHYWDPTSGYHDREDNIYMFRDLVSGNFPSRLERRVVVDVVLQDGTVIVKSAAIDGGTYVGIRVHEGDPWD